MVSLFLTRPWLIQPPKGCQTDWISLSPYIVALLCSILLFWPPLLQELRSTPCLGSRYHFLLDAPPCSWTSPSQSPPWSPAAPYPGLFGSLVSSYSPWAIPSHTVSTSYWGVQLSSLAHSPLQAHIPRAYSYLNIPWLFNINISQVNLAILSSQTILLCLPSASSSRTKWDSFGLPPLSHTPPFLTFNDSPGHGFHLEPLS